MPKDPSIKKVLLIGSGPIIIGQAAEFDYAGAQACRALREEGIEIVLVNSNPATIMTDKDMADHVYIEPINVPSLEAIIAKERPDSILPTLGGQVGLNMAMNLYEEGILEKYNVRMLGTSADSIRAAEDRQGFKDCMMSIHQPIVDSLVVHDVESALQYADDVIGYPVVVRPAYTLGGTGGGIAKDRAELEEIANRGITASRVGEILVERCISGWKEIEFEVMRDAAGNVIQIASLENVDPVGVHTGDSIVVAPTQTLANKEYQMLRTAALDIITALKIEGGCNVQFALKPDSFEYDVIEVNPRVSRSSALASKATGYPIARVATKIALGYHLDEIKNVVTGKTTACFEPTLDYCVVKMPRLPFDKFTTADRTLGTQMKATGEVMAIDNTFEGALMKAIRSLEQHVYCLRLNKLVDKTADELREMLQTPTDERIYQIAEALRKGVSKEEIYRITWIDPWFLDRYQNIIDMEDKLRDLQALPDPETLLLAKQMGFTDDYIAELTGQNRKDVKALRMANGIVPAYKMVDTCAAEFDAETPYFYSTYDKENESIPSNNPKKVLVLGSGPIRIGQGIEFDYCSVHSVWALKKLGYEAIIINNNPETVSTDFDTSDRLYFEPLTREDVENVIELEKPWGVMVQFGGQTAINLVSALTEMGVRILGTPADGIDAAEDRERFEKVLEKYQIPKAKGLTVFTTEEALDAAHELGYPVLVRPSYVLGGAGMEIAYSDQNIRDFMSIINMNVQEHPILVDKYLLGREIEVDAVFDGEDILIPGVMELVERAGIHSGDSISVYPPVHLEEKHKQKILKDTYMMAKELGVLGVVNVQYILYDDDIYVIEVNPRSSRTVPFISKVTGVPIIELATRVMMGEKLKDLGYGTGIYPEVDYYAVKMPVFSFEKLGQVDITMGPEMKSTGECLGIAETYPQALLKALKGANFKIPKRGGKIIITVRDEDKGEVLSVARGFQNMGIEILATSGTAAYLNSHGVVATVVKRLSEGHPNIGDLIRSGSISLIINTPAKYHESMQSDGFQIRQYAVQHSVMCVTSVDTAQAILLVAKHAHASDLVPIDITTLDNQPKDKRD